MKNYTVSILIPTYNREDFIGECIQSALDQTYADIEVIVVDNASTDGTWAIVQEMARLDARVRAFQNVNNLGPVRNWRKCAEEARGEYSKILFSDDLMAPDFIAHCLPLLQDPDIAFVFTAAYIGDAMGRGTVGYQIGAKTKYSIDEYHDLLIRERMPFSPGAALFRTADIRKNLHDTLPTCRRHEFWRHGAGPDIMLYALTALDYTAFAAIAEPLVLFRAHSRSISITNSNNEVLEGYRAALSWYFSKRVSTSLWYDYLVWQWTTEARLTMSWIDVEQFLTRYEGTGTRLERIQFGAKAVLLIFSRTYRKLFRSRENMETLELSSDLGVLDKT